MNRYKKVEHMPKGFPTSKELQNNENSSNVGSTKEPNIKPCLTTLQHSRRHYDHQKLPYLLTPRDLVIIAKRKTIHKKTTETKRVS